MTHAPNDKDDELHLWILYTYLVKIQVLRHSNISRDALRTDTTPFCHFRQTATFDVIIFCRDIFVCALKRAGSLPELGRIPAGNARTPQTKRVGHYRSSFLFYLTSQ
jgi:hypothetical protein